MGCSTLSNNILSLFSLAAGRKPHHPCTEIVNSWKDSFFMELFVIVFFVCKCNNTMLTYHFLFNHL